VKQDCACLCGASGLTIAGDSIGRFLCHCTICQKVYGKPFADVTYFWAESVALRANQRVEFRRLNGRGETFQTMRPRVGAEASVEGRP
jgi:hypothetical protein